MYRTPQNESLLLLAVKHRLEVVADHLCEVLGMELSMADSKGNSPLWVALRSRQEAIATKLVSFVMWAWQLWSELQYSGADTSGSCLLSLIGRLSLSRRSIYTQKNQLIVCPLYRGCLYRGGSFVRGQKELCKGNISTGECVSLSDLEPAPSFRLLMWRVVLTVMKATYSVDHEDYA